MTKTLSERLRHYAQTMGGGASHILNKAAVEAADEIERLEGEAEIVDEQLAQLRGFAEGHKGCENRLDFIRGWLEHWKDKIPATAVAVLRGALPHAPEPRSCPSCPDPGGCALPDGTFDCRNSVKSNPPRYCEHGSLVQDLPGKPNATMCDNWPCAPTSKPV